MRKMVFDPIICCSAAANHSYVYPYYVDVNLPTVDSVNVKACVPIINNMSSESSR
jgi:hypothetical protein